MIRECNNLTELRNLVWTPPAVPTVGDLAYLKGHGMPGDGGGGYFVLMTKISLGTGIHDADNDGTVIACNANTSFLWVRQYDGYINILFFGADTSITGDATAAIQKAIDFAEKNVKNPNTPLKGNVVYFPTGGSYVKTLVLKNGVSLLGGTNDAGFTLYSYKGYGGYMFTLAPGTVSTNVSNLVLRGQHDVIGEFHAATGCFNLEAAAISGQTTGGLIDSTFKNLKIINFSQHCIYLNGGQSSGLVHQRTIFENVRAVRDENFAYALLMTGLNSQMTFLNCTFDGFKKGNLYALSANIGLSDENGNFPKGISFINTTSQDADYGVSIVNAENITFDTCWFENLGVGISVQGTNGHISKSINILNNRFANVGGYGVLSVVEPTNIKWGHTIMSQDSQINVQNNYTSEFRAPEPGKACRFIWITGTNQGTNASGNSFQNEPTDITLGLVPDIPITITPAPAKLNCMHNQAVFVSNANTVSTPVCILSSTLNAGETLTVKAHAGDIYFANTHNILYVPSALTLKLKNGGVAVFCRVDRDYNGFNSFFMLTRLIEP